MEPRCSEPLFNEVIDIFYTNGNRRPSYRKIYTVDNLVIANIFAGPLSLRYIEVSLYLQ